MKRFTKWYDKHYVEILEIITFLWLVENFAFMIFSQI